MAFGLKLAQRGYVTFCPRNYLWPDNHHIAAQAEARADVAEQKLAEVMERIAALESAKEGQE